MTDRATRSDPEEDSIGCAQRKLRNIRPSGAFWPEITLWNVTHSDRRSRDPKGVPLGVRTRNRNLRIIRPSGDFWQEITSSAVGIPLEVGVLSRTSASYK